MKLEAIIGTTVVAFSLTFGHAYHSPGISEMSVDGVVKTTPPGARSMGAFVAAMFFPLYWSTHLMAPSEPNT